MNRLKEIVFSFTGLRLIACVMILGALGQAVCNDGFAGCSAKCDEISEVIDRSPSITGPKRHWEVQRPAGAELDTCYRVVISNNFEGALAEGSTETWKMYRSTEPSEECEPNSQIFGTGTGGGGTMGDPSDFTCYEGCAEEEVE